IHSTPGRPEGRGKIERVFRTVRDQLLVELEDRPPASLEDLNRIFQSWAEQVYHRRVHSETQQTPLERFLAPGVPRRPSETSLREAFRWSERRTVSKTGTVGMHGNTYEVDPELAGRQVDLIFDPLELTEVEVRLDGHHRGTAIPRVIKRHIHPRAQPAPEKPPAPTGIDYLGLIQKRREQELQQRIDYRSLPTTGNENNNENENEEMTG
ncbi:MAG: Mu transposase C-terminal domain-containing protein, partial [Solirubrobacteraceae bacterium]